MKDKQMLQYIYKTAEMGKEGILSIINENKDPRMERVLKQQYRSYSDIYSTSTNYLNARGIMPKSVGPLTKISVSMTGAMKTLGDHSPSKIAELMIRGTTTGLTKSIKHIKDYAGNDARVLELAHQLKQIEENSIEELKPFL